jgi:hypothetical protein
MDNVVKPGDFLFILQPNENPRFVVTLFAVRATHTFNKFAEVACGSHFPATKHRRQKKKELNCIATVGPLQYNASGGLGTINSSQEPRRMKMNATRQAHFRQQATTCWPRAGQSSYSAALPQPHLPQPPSRDAAYVPGVLRRLAGGAVPNNYQ